MAVARWGQNYHCRDGLQSSPSTDVALLDFVDSSFAKVASQLLASATLETNVGRTFQCYAISYSLFLNRLRVKKLRACSHHSSRRSRQFGSASESAVL